MKIISGRLKGRKIIGYDVTGTRPTMDRVRESLFGMIQNYVSDAVCLDLFAGSGALGLEAISEGAKMCYFNDKNHLCCNNILKMIKEFDLSSSAVVMNKDYRDALSSVIEKDLKFDIIFLDPPYKMQVLNEVISDIIRFKLLNHKGIIVCEVNDNYLDEWDELEVIKMKKYSDKYIIIIKNN